MVVIAIGTFIVGLCCIPLMREYWTQRETERYRDIIKGERDLRDQLEAMGISENGSVGSMNTWVEKKKKKTEKKKKIQIYNMRNF